MIRQNIFIVGFRGLYNILEEIKNNLTYKIFNYINENEFLKSLNSNSLDLANSLVIVKSINTKLIDNKKLDKRIIYAFENLPIEIDKLLELINVQLIKQKYNYQSKINIKNYIINLNSRTIIKNNKSLKLTEKEINIILFLNNKKPQKINILQNEVWGYSSELETHTVETHVYRLRKKIKDMFDDDNFILSHDDGYLIQ
jgi:hypothetical protein